MGATALPLSTNWSVLYSSEFLLCRARAVELFFCCCGVKQRSVLGTVAPRVCCLQLVPQRRPPAALRARHPPSEPARRCGRDPTTNTAQMLGFFCLASLTSSSMQLTSHRHRHRPHHRRTRFALSASPTRPSHAHMCKQHLGRPSDALSDPQTPFFDDSSHPQHAHATRSGKHAADNVSLRDLRIETADGHLTPDINPREANSAQSIDRKRQPAKIPRELGPHPTPNTHTNTQHTPTTRLPVRIMGAKQKRVAILQP